MITVLLFLLCGVIAAISPGWNDDPNYAQCSISGYSPLDYNGNILMVNLILPENVNADVFYNFDLTKCSARFSNGKTDTLNHESGGIKITQRDNEGGLPPVALRTSTELSHHAA